MGLPTAPENNAGGSYIGDAIDASDLSLVPHEVSPPRSPDVSPVHEESPSEVERKEEKEDPEVKEKSEGKDGKEGATKKKRRERIALKEGKEEVSSGQEA